MNHAEIAKALHTTADNVAEGNASGVIALVASPTDSSDPAHRALDVIFAGHALESVEMVSTFIKEVVQRSPEDKERTAMYLMNLAAELAGMTTDE